MSAGVIDITIEPGASYEEIYDYDLTDASGSDLDFSSGYTAAAQVRHHYDDASAALTLSVNIATAGQIKVSATAASTQALQDSFRRGVWDLELTKTSGGNKIRLLQGTVRVNPQVTQ